MGITKVCFSIGDIFFQADSVPSDDVRSLFQSFALLANAKISNLCTLDHLATSVAINDVAKKTEVENTPAVVGAATAGE